MLEKENIMEILDKARAIDQWYDLFAANTHKYKLNPPIEAEFLRSVEKKYGFSLPEDYFYFLTQIGNGGAGPDYGIYSWDHFLEVGKDKYAQDYLEEYRKGVGGEFRPRLMKPCEVSTYGYYRLFRWISCHRNSWLPMGFWHNY